MSELHSPQKSTFLVAACLVAGGCASNYGWQTETAEADFVDGTRVLGELIMSAARSQVLSEQGIFRGWRAKLLESGYTDADIVDGSEVTVWSYCYAHNSGVPLCTHHGHYLVHVPEEFRAGLSFDDDVGSDARGDLVEIELRTTPSGKIVGNWIGVYRKAADWGDCRVEELRRSSLSSTVSILGGVGPPRANWLECESAADDGWLRRVVPGAPPPYEQFPVSQWIKRPQG